MTGGILFMILGFLLSGVSGVYVKNKDLSVVLFLMGMFFALLGYILVIRNPV